MKIIDISWPITSDMTAYKDRKTVTFSFHKAFPKDAVCQSELQFDTHTGTHVDAPRHFLEDGGTVDTIGLDRLVGTCRLLDFTHVSDAISEYDLKAHTIKQSDIVLLKTKNSYRDATDAFDYNFIYLNVSGAHYLAQRGVKAVGIDFLGIERSQSDHGTHKALLGAGVPIIEGLRLAIVEAGVYTIYCLPLAICGLEAAPARAILIAP